MLTTDATTKRVWTEADVRSLPEDGSIHEVVDGESATRRQLLGSGGFLDSGGVLPGFRHAIAGLFKDWAGD